MPTIWPHTLVWVDDEQEPDRSPRVNHGAKRGVTKSPRTRRKK